MSDNKLNKDGAGMIDVSSDHIPPIVMETHIGSNGEFRCCTQRIADGYCEEYGFDSFKGALGSLSIQDLRNNSTVFRDTFIKHNDDWKIYFEERKSQDVES